MRPKVTTTRAPMRQQGCGLYAPSPKPALGVRRRPGACRKRRPGSICLPWIQKRSPPKQKARRLSRPPAGGPARVRAPLPRVSNPRWGHSAWRFASERGREQLARAARQSPPRARRGSPIPNSASRGVCPGSAPMYPPRTGICASFTVSRTTRRVGVTTSSVNVSAMFNRD